MQQEQHRSGFDGVALAREVLVKIKDYVAHATRPLIERLDAHAQRAESTDLLVADLDARIAEVERRLPRQHEAERE